MCKTYQQRDEDDCACFYTIDMLKKQAADESRWFRRLVGWVVKGVVGFVAVVGMGIVWMLNRVWRVLVWAYNDMFPRVEAKPVIEPVIEPVAKPTQPVYSFYLRELDKVKHE